MSQLRLPSSQLCGIMWSVTCTVSKQLQSLFLCYNKVPCIPKRVCVTKRPPWRLYADQYPDIHAQNTDLNQGSQRPKPMQSPESISTNITQYFALYYQYCQNGSWWEPHQMLSPFTKTPRMHRRASNILKIRTILHLSHPSIQCVMETPSFRVVAEAWIWWPPSS